MNTKGAHAAMRPARRSQQTIRVPENFIPESLWVKLRSDIAVTSKEGLLARLFTALHCDCPSETTLFRAAAFIAYCYVSIEITQATLNGHREQLRRLIKSQSCDDGTLPYLRVYPDSADGLPSAILTSAYGGTTTDVIPVPVVIPELDWLTADKRIRKEKTPSWL